MVQRFTPESKSGVYRGMFALLVSLHHGSDLFTELTGGSVITGHDAEATSQLSPELIAKEQNKAKQGFCETYLWNCTDLCKSSVLFVCMQTLSNSRPFLLCFNVWMDVDEQMVQATEVIDKETVCMLQSSLL